MKLEAFITEARRLQYLHDEGFYDPANRGKPNYRKSTKISWEPDPDVLKVIKRWVKLLTKAAGVTPQIAFDALCNSAIKQKILDDMIFDGKNLFKKQV